MRSGWAAFFLSLGLGACAQDVDDLPVPRAWSYGSAEVAVVEAPAGGALPPARPAPLPVRADAPGALSRSLQALGRSLTAWGSHDDRWVATGALPGSPRRR